MPYSREYSKERYIEIEEHLTQLEELKEGKILSISYSSPEEAEKARWLFYDYFHLAGISRKYKTTLFSNLLFIGEKKPTLLNLTNTREEEGVTKRLETIIQGLLILPAPRSRLAELALDESISFTALAIVLGELGRVLGE